jgi:hypothetical protein
MGKWIDHTAWKRGLLRHSSCQTGEARRSASQHYIVNTVIGCAGEKELHGTADFLSHTFDKRLQYTTAVIIWQIAIALFGFCLFRRKSILPDN